MTTRPLLLGLAALLLSACPRADRETMTSDAGVTHEAGTTGAPCGALFGNPNAETGLSSDQCKPECACGGTVFAPPTYDAAFIQSLVDDWQLDVPYPPLGSDPYAGPPPSPEPADTVCAVLPQGDASQKPRAYSLITYPSEDAARAAGAEPTHFGGCGVCSTLANLAVYMRNNDLTAPVRDCGLAPSTDGGNGDVDCLMKLGFDLPCAQAWAYDTSHTRDECISICLPHLSDPYNLPDGSLNPCIQCDEDKSGPVFKAVAGRTRRNSGIPNAICRPCSEVRPLVHAY